MRIGIFGGSFDPVHLEHVRLAECAIQELALDKLLIIPACIPPHKQGKRLAPEQDRLAACRTAFSHLDKAEVSGYEIHKRGTSYTFETCRYFQEKYAPSQLFFLVGTDMLRNFPTWKNPEDILLTATLVVCARAEEEGWEEKERALFLERFGIDFLTLSYQGKALSSTKIRVLLAAGENVSELVGGKVAKLLNERGVYAMNGVKQGLSWQSSARRAHTLRVAELAALLANHYKMDERKAIKAALLHDCAKNLPLEYSLLSGFTPPKEVPSAIFHQYAGAYLAEKVLGEKDEEILNAVRYHTSGRPKMSALEKIVFLADLLEPERRFVGVERLRELLWKDLDECLTLALQETIAYLQRDGKEIYSLTVEAYEFYKEKKNGTD